MTFIVALIIALALPGPAEAAPVVAAIVGVVKAVAAWKIGGFAAGAFLLRTAASYALSLLARAVKDKPKQPGIRTEVTQLGEGTPGNLIFGRYATAGTLIAPPMTQGQEGDTPNAYLTYVIELCDMPIASLDGIWINDDHPAILAPAAGRYPDHNRVGGKYADKAWLRFFDGSQTTAYSGLVNENDSAWPWQADMIGTGLSYVVVRFRYDRELYQGLPSVMFEVTGIGFYDPRLDSTVPGGSGPQRWGQRSTYEPSENPAVQIYNILRGIELPDGSVWGGSCAAEDLPIGNWFAAMNVADEDVNGEPRYRSSYEVKIGPSELGGDQPADVIDELLRGSAGQIAEFGGVYTIRLGGPGLPVKFFSSDDVYITEEQVWEPFPTLGQTVNGVQAQYPEPSERWATKEAPPRYSAEFEAEDQGRRLVASIQLPATPYRRQVQRVMRHYLREERRFGRVSLGAPPDFAALEPLDAVAYSSAADGFVEKVFEITGRGDDPLTMNQRLDMRERDSSDQAWEPGFELPSTVGTPTTPLPAPREVLNFAVFPASVRDANNDARRPAIGMSWNVDQPDLRGLRYRIRPAGQSAIIARGSVEGIEDGEHIHSEGILGATAYEVSARPITRRRSVWTGWFPVTTFDLGLSWDDFEAEVRDAVDDAMAQADAAAAAAAAANAEHLVIRDDLDAAVIGLQGDIEDARVELGADIAEAAAEIAQARADIDGVSAEIAQARTDIGADIADIETLAMDNLNVARDYTDTSVQAEAAIRQTATDALAAQIQTLTAVLNSENYIENPRFSDGFTGWSGHRALSTVVAKDDLSADPIIANAPTAFFASVPTVDGAFRDIYQDFSVDWLESEVFQWRCYAAVAEAGREARVVINWYDDLGAVIGSAVHVVMALVEDEWRVFSGQHAPPAGTVSVRFRLRVPSAVSTVPVAFADVSFTKVDQSVIARITDLEVVVASQESAQAAWNSAATARMGDNEAAITTEASARATQDGVLSGRIDTVEAEVGDNAAAITAEQIARANADSALAGQITTVSAVANRARTFRGSTAPASPMLGDIWYDTGDNRQAYRWGGANWLPVDDVRISQNAAAITSEQIARANADSALGLRIDTVEAEVGDNAAAITAEAIARSNADSALAGQITTVSAVANRARTFRSSSAPTSPEIGDIWYDTGNDRQAYRWGGANWLPVDDVRISQNAAAITSEQTARANADSALGLRIDTVEAEVGDNAAAITAEAIARSNADSALAGQITTVSAVANSKNRIYRQAAAPANVPAGTLVAGDLWFDSDDSNRVYRWSGSVWQLTEDPRIAQNTADIVSEQIARANADSALAGTITTIDAKYGASAKSPDLVINGSFLNGDLAGWTSVDAGLTVIPRGAGGGASAIDNAPTPFVLRASDDGTQQQGHAAQAIPCRPGERFLIEAEVAGAGGGGGLNFSWQLFLRFYNVTGGIVATQSRTIAVTSTSWTKPALAPFSTPAGAVTCNLIVRRVGGGAGFSYLTNLRLDVERGFSALNAASITQEAIARAEEDGAMATQINTVTATVNSKNKTFRQAAQPANNGTNDLRAGDIWYDTANGNRVFRWSGSAWALTDDARIAATAATVTTQATAIGNIQTGLQAGYLMRAQAGNAVSLIDMVAADNSGGVPSSIIKLKADDILFQGSVGMEMLTLTDLSGNMVPDAEMVSATAWGINPSGAGDWLMSSPADFNWSRGESAGEIQYRGSGGSFAVRAGLEFSVLQGVEYTLSGKVRYARGGTSGQLSARIRIEWLDVNGASLGAVVIASLSTDTGSSPNYAEAEVSHTAPTGARRARIRCEVLATNEVWVGFNSVTCIRKRTGATLITPGGVTADLITANTMRALNAQFVSLAAANISVGNAEIGSAHIENLAVGRIKIADGAVTEFPFSFTAGDIALTPQGAWVNIQTVVFSRGRPDPLPLFIQVQQATTGGTTQYRLRRNGSVVWSSETLNQNPGEYFIITFVDSKTSTGAVTYRLDARCVAPTNTGYLRNRFLGGLNAFK